MAAEICWKTRIRRPRGTVCMFLETMNTFSFYIVIKATFLRKCLDMHTHLQGIESILKVVWIVSHRNKFITRLYIYIIFVIFQTSASKQCDDSQPDVPTVSDENFYPSKLDISESFAKQEILNDISRKNLLYNVFQPRKALLQQQNNCMDVSGHSTLNYGPSGILFQFIVESWAPYFVCCAFYLKHDRHHCSINYHALASGTKREKRWRNITTLVLAKKLC